VLHHIALGPLAEQPAGEHPPPFLLARSADVELHKRADLLLALPRGGRLAGAQADDGVADAERLPRLHGKVAGDAVALVEEANDSNALVHRCHARHIAEGFDVKRAAIRRDRL
jgi:hypothetical protein